jgi:hypothetical protein
MAELRFSRGDIERLMDKLSTLDPPLTDREQRLLLAIFSVAADHARQPPAADSADALAEAGLAELRDQIVRSFVPGTSDDFLIDVATKIGGR